MDAEGSTKQELMDKAHDADVPGRSQMSKSELADARRKSNDRATAKAREKA